MSDFTRPTSRRITQPYGAEFDDWDGDGDVDYPGGFYHSIGWDGHNGIDYACGLGDPIEAVADGYVSFAAWAGTHWLLSGGGNAILVEHAAHKVQTEYLHLSRFAVSAGQWVKKGQVIGFAGKTGAATGYHLHLGMLPLTGINVNNRMRGRIDPTPYLYGGLSPQGTITNQEDELSAQDVEALQLINNANTDRAILDNRAQLRALGDELVKKINDESYEIQLWDQQTDNQTGDRIIDALRADIGAMSPSTIASLIPASIAQQVANELAKRLVK